MSYQIALCDDEPYFCEELQRHLHRFEEESGREFKLDTFHNAEDLLEHVQKNFYHLLLLDIEIDSVSGIDVAEKIRSFNTDIQIIFATCYQNYALPAYQLDAIGYLVKPIEYEEVEKILRKTLRIIDYVTKRISGENVIDILVKGETLSIPFDSILYLEKSRNKTIIYTEQTSFTTYDSLANLLKRLDQNLFMQIHQGYIVNYLHLTFIEKNHVLINHKIHLPISRKYYKEVNRRFMDDLLI